MALLLHQFTAVEEAARLVLASAPGTLPEVGKLGVQLVVNAALGLLVLLVVTVLSVFKPWGRTAYGRRKAGPATPGAEKAPVRLPSGLKAVLYAVGALVTAFIVAHLAGGGLAKHQH